MPNTLFGRLLLASFIVLTIFFGTLGYVVLQIFIDNLIETKEQQIELHNYVLLSSAIPGDNTVEMPEILREERFDQYQSGLYGYISRQDGSQLWQSYSAYNTSIDPSLLAANNPQIGNAEFNVTEQFFIYHYSVLWEIVDNQQELLTFTVLEDRAPSSAIINDFSDRLKLWLAITGISLIAILLIILRWGTEPLRQLAQKLKQVEQGERSSIEGNYPRELEPVVSNLNELLVTERKQRDRYHATLADLAHSLKTPLAVIQGELRTSKANHHLVVEQTERMDDIIKHQLQRAVAGSSHKLADNVSIKACITRLTTALAKVYQQKQITFAVDINETTHVKGDQRDLMEILGNVLDNACKACKQQIKIVATEKNHVAIIDIHDDGDGIEPSLREEIIKRGQRADTRHSGQGIGLDVVRDIIDSYQGKLSIDESPLGGALFQIQLPA